MTKTEEYMESKYKILSQIVEGLTTGEIERDDRSWWSNEWAIEKRNREGIGDYYEVCGDVCFKLEDTELIDWLENGRVTSVEQN